ncbi:XRE family transcriptional regulator [Actinoplanes sp. ATCC 53533]|uniref:tetratricopeptide repeat protein n=1 Tax=Actinoplanes sp. ATCC 53533 TaxID=1288362 RepID=UPI000F770421|nr:tetratricopeptide repeat protein [Actinoplanes sp. ATCC 53533]RSM51494.1 XRE family transcriptional regulator [Actinoplanes sp. ATCC 53533]
MTVGTAVTPPHTAVAPSAAGAPLTRFVGREAEIAALLAAARRTRLLSLVGPGGSGKTRLAHVVRDRLAATGGQPTWWVSLAQLDRPALLLSALADAVRAVEVPGQSLLEVIVGQLRERDGLLVLDNCEHLVAECAALAGELLRACPALRILTTSREPLAAAGETTWWLEGLSVPDDLPAPRAADLAGSQAVRLFTDRARLVLPGFAVTDANAADLARLCRRLDGMPLALELAAARLRVLPLPRIVGWLDDAVSLLVTTGRDVPARQATLRATLDWSYDLLPAAERDLFARLSVFRGGFTLAAAAAVAGDDAGVLDTLELLGRLVDKSLVQARTDGEEERYRLLEVVRQYAAEHLGDRAGTTAIRHACFMLELAERAEHGLAGGDLRLWLDGLHRDRNNIRAALSWSRHHNPGLGARLAGALGRYWRLSGQYAEGRQWLAASVAATDGTTGPAARAKALTALGTLEFLQCEYDQAVARLSQAHRLYTRIGDDRGTAAALQSLASIAREQGRYAEARQHHREVLAVGRRRGDPAAEARAIKSMGFTAWLEGDHLAAIESSTDAVRRFRELGDDEGLAGALVDLAAATFRRGDPDGAIPLLRQSLAIADRLGLREATAWAQEQLGLIAAARGERAEAVRLLRHSLGVHHELGDRWRTACVLDALAGQQDDPAGSARLLAAAARLREMIGTPVPPCDLADHEQRSRAVHAALSPAQVERASMEGRALSVEQAVAAVLGGEPAVLGGEPAALAEAAPAAEFVARALGRGLVAVSGRELTPEDWTYAKPRELLFYLLTRPGSRKSEIGLALWPEASGTELRNSFHTCLRFLRRALGDAARVRYAGGTYRVEPVLPLRYDVEDFRTAAAAARGHDGTPAAIGALTEAAARYPGDFLGDVPVGAWAEPHREELRREYEHVLRTLGGLLAKGRRFAEAAEVFARLVAHDPLLEAAHRGLMRCHAALGDRGRALRQYEHLVGLLEEQLGVPPSPETAELHARLFPRR